MKFKKSQSGRSMVEMLGVLAIIGVLSVGGIAGYSLSMRRHRANQLADIASKYAMVLYSSCQKHIMDGGKIGSPVECLEDVLPSFEEADVGPIPSGVNVINSYYVDFDGPNENALFAVYFDDTKLCQAFASVVGGSCSNKGVLVSIKQN